MKRTATTFPLRGMLRLLPLLPAVMLTVSAQNALWDLDSLFQTPSANWIGATGAVQEVHYEGVPRDSNPTRVFAYVARPAGVAGRATHPAMVLVHGGGGKAFREWAEHWAARGYFAIAMDLAGNGPSGRLADGGPDQSDAIKFRNFTRAEADQMWSYHAVAAVIRGHSLLRSLPGVDTNRVGLTGISWGGYLTCIVAGLDSRFRVAVPVYGCGFLGDNSYWADKSLASMQPEARALWLELFDPGRYLANTRCPILFLNGTTDFAYPLDSYRKSYELVNAERRHVAVVVDLPHGHIWTFPEVDAFVGSVLRQEPPLPKLGPINRVGGELRVTQSHGVPIGHATLCFTTSSGPWQKRRWETRPARVEGATVRANLPPEPPTAAFIAVTDILGRRVSTEHVD